MIRDTTYLIGNTFAAGSGPNKTSFKPGAVPWNKGLHVATSPACFRTTFKPGMVAINRKPVGSITVRVDKNGTARRWIKVSESRPSWKPYPQWLWESKRGPIPSGMIVHHVDGNALNDSLDNYKLVSRSEHINAHRRDLLAAKRLINQRCATVTPGLPFPA